MFYKNIPTLTEVKYLVTVFKPELVTKYPIATIGLFGSIVRDDFTTNSDIVIIIEFNDKIGIEFVELAEQLEILLEWKVDLVSRKDIKPKYLEVIDPEIIYI